MHDAGGVYVRSDAHAALGAAIRHARRTQGFSQERLGLESGLDRTYVGGIERGERNPSYGNLLKIAACLNTPLSQIIRDAEQNARQSRLSPS